MKWKEIEKDGLPNEDSLCIGAFKERIDLIFCIYDKRTKKFQIDDYKSKYALFPLHIDYYLELEYPKK